MAAPQFILLITRELADEKHRPLLIGVILAPLFLIVGILLLIVGGLSFFATTLGTFLTEDTSLVGETVAAMDKARDAYVEEQMALYRQRTDLNGKPYRNVVLQWENGFSNNDKEILTIVSCYYEQDWEIDMSDLASWAVLKSISFTTRERGPYSCGGCRSRKVCDGHPDGNGGTYHHSDDAADCDNYHTVTYCPGDHYDLYVTATLPGCQTWNDEAGATEQTIARWDDLVDLSYTGSSAVMQQYQQAVRMATLNEDWEGWSELNVEWSKVLFQTDWQELYGVTITQVGITDSGSYTPDDSFTGNLPGSGNGTFILPLASYSYISCHFGEADGWTGAPHGGMDFAAAYGTPIFAVADGVVVKAGWHNSWGNYVKIYHGVVDGNQIYTLYAHCSSLGVSAGQTVTQGQTIAAVGSTGDSTGNHLHFEVYVNGARVDPEGWLLQEVMREILEAYYEPQFSNHSHGFRPNRGCHTALQEIQIWKGTRWFIEGDISKYFDTIDHDVLLKILEKNIHDGRFLRLISNMLKAGYLDDWKFNQTISGTPQGGVISPLLANIYLNEFDQWLENTLIPQYTKGKRQKSNPAYNRMNAEISKARKNRDIQTAHKLEVERRNIPSVDPYDENYRRCRYVRYADDFLIGFTGSKADAEEIKAAMHNFLENELHLELSQEKTLITNASSQAAKFLGYEIKAQRANDYIDPKGRRGANGAIALLVPAKVIESKCQSFKRNGKVTHRNALLQDDDFSIVQQFQAEYRGLVQYYILAQNLSWFSTLYWVMETSLLKTLACKHRSSMKKQKKKYRTTTTSTSGKEVPCLQVVVPRPGKKPLVATWGGILPCPQAQSHY